jgi:hypothetical protein
MPPKGFPLALFDMHFENWFLILLVISMTVKLVQKIVGLKSIFEIQHYQKKNKV